MSPILRQLHDTGKAQLALLLRARIVFTELFPGNALIKYATLLSITYFHFVLKDRMIVKMKTMADRKDLQLNVWWEAGEPPINKVLLF
jgi:hypothetical protein